MVTMCFAFRYEGQEPSYCAHVQQSGSRGLAGGERVLSQKVASIMGKPQSINIKVYKRRKAHDEALWLQEGVLSYVRVWCLLPQED
jgi:hypothetical protein